jgi:hypothetical protein
MSRNPLFSHEDLKKRFPNASPAFLAANLDVQVPDQTGRAPQSSEPERPVRNDTLATKSRKVGHAKRGGVRYRVSVVSFRTRLIDPDNLTPKYFIDAARYAGLIPDDSAEHIELSVTQKKDSKNPRTEITIEEIP